MALELLLELEGFSPTGVDRGEEAIKLLSRERYDLILLDLTTNGITADEFMNRLQSLEQDQNIPHTPVCILSASATIQEEARRLKADLVIRKPFEHNEFIDILRAFMARQGLPDEASRSKAG